MTNETNTIDAKAMLATLKISQWTARKLDKKTTERVAQENGIDPKKGSYYKTLIGSERLDEIKRKTNELRTYHYRMTLPWSDEGPRVLAADAYFEYMQEVGRLRGEFDALVNQFVQEYPYAREEARRMLGSLFDETDYPPTDQVEDKFSVAIDIKPLPTGEDFRVSLSEEEVARVRQQIEQQTQAQIQSSMEAVYDRISKVIDQYIDRLEGEKTIFRDSLVENAQELARLLPSFNLTNDPGLNQLADRIQRDLCKFQPDDLRKDKDARREAFNSARDIKSELLETLGGSYS